MHFYVYNSKRSIRYWTDQGFKLWLDPTVNKNVKFILLVRILKGWAYFVIVEMSFLVQQFKHDFRSTLPLFLNGARKGRTSFHV